MTIAAGRYSAFFTHVVIWDDKVAAHDAHANAPGLGRLSLYLRDLADGSRHQVPLTEPL
jgi:hypothetical protein